MITRVTTTKSSLAISRYRGRMLRTRGRHSRKKEQKAHLPRHFLKVEGRLRKTPFGRRFLPYAIYCLCCGYIADGRWRALVQLSSVPWRLCAVSLQTRGWRGQVIFGVPDLSSLTKSQIWPDSGFLPLRYLGLL